MDCSYNNILAEGGLILAVTYLFREVVEAGLHLFAEASFPVLDAFNLRSM